MVLGRLLQGRRKPRLLQVANASLPEVFHSYQEPLQFRRERSAS